MYESPKCEIFEMQVEAGLCQTIPYGGSSDDLDGPVWAE